MRYEFQAQDGEIIERDYPMKDAPPFGTIIEVNGKKYERVVSASVQVDTRFTQWTYPIVSNALPRKIPGCQHDSKGRPIIENARHHERIAKDYGMVLD